MTNYTWVIGGGAGDIIRDFYWKGQYAALEELKPEDTCDIHILSHNPFVEEFFHWHPKTIQLTVKSWGYVVPDEDEVKRKEFDIPLEGTYRELPCSAKPVTFYPNPGDMQVLEFFDAVHEKYGTVGYCMSSIAAGDYDRTFPQDIKVLLEGLLDEKTDFRQYINLAVGRNFKRGDRLEDVASLGNWNVGMVDCLSLSGTCKLLEGAAGLITCHSVLSMLAFLIHKPQLLLYPETVRQRHFLHPDMWSFGASSPECVHCTFDDFEKNPQHYIDRFLTVLKEYKK